MSPKGRERGRVLGEGQLDPSSWSGEALYNNKLPQRSLKLNLVHFSRKMWHLVRLATTNG